MSLHGNRVFAAWVKSTLAAGGVTVELGVKPKTVPAGSGYSVVYPIAGGVTDGTLENPNEDATPDVQVTSVGSSAEQTLWQVDKVRTVLLAAVPATLSDGRRVVFVEPTFGGPSLFVDNDVQPPVWYVPDRLSFRTVSG